MDKIVNLGQRIQKKKQRENRDIYLKKIRSLQRSVQCTACHLRCAMCGIRAQIKNDTERDFFLSNGFALCEDCKKEYDDFADQRQGKGSSDISWHNKEWYHMWSAWMEYRKSLRKFLESPEFKQLQEELNE